jgi:hypothetical protein
MYNLLYVVILRRKKTRRSGLYWRFTMNVYLFNVDSVREFFELHGEGFAQALIGHLQNS